MKRIINLKHWQLFLIMLLPVLVSELIPTDMFLLRTLLSFISFFTLFFWMYSIVYVLSEEVFKGERQNKKYYLTAYLVFIFAGVAGYLLNKYFILTNGRSINIGDGVLFWFMLILIMCSLWCIFYIYYYTARTISLTNIKLNPDEGSITTNYFLAFWFYIIGIWFIQPKIKELLSMNERAENN
jgi:hypothetical protein